MQIGRPTASTVGGRPSGTHHCLAIAFLLLAFLCIAAIRWSGELPIGTDSDEHLIVARTFIRTGHFSVADVHSTKYPPLISSIAILFHYFGLRVPLSMVVFNYLLVLASALTLYALILRSDRIGLFSLLPILYLMSNTVLWDSAGEIIADALFFFLVSVVLLLALRVERWTPRTTLLASLLAFLATMARSVGLVVILPLAVSIISDHRRRGRSFPYAKIALLALLPSAGLALYMIYQAGFGPHTTGYLETFWLKDPFDASKGNLTPLSFLERAISGSIACLREIRDLTVYPSSAGVFSLPAAIYPSLAGLFSLAAVVALLIFALGRDRKRIFVLSSFLLPYLLVIALWPYRGVRFVLPLLAVSTLGLGGALAAGLRSRNRALTYILALLLLSHIAINTAHLRRHAAEERAARAGLRSQVSDLVEWCRANIPEAENIASFDYRALILRLDRPVTPLSYSSDTQMHISQLRREHVKWLLLCRHIYPLRATYAESIVDALGERASLRYRNDSCEAYRIDLQ